MVREKFEFTDIGNSHDNLMSGGYKKGCQVSPAVGFVLALLAILIAVGVGVIVHFAGNNARTVECKCTFPGITPQGTFSPLVQQCMEDCKAGKKPCETTQEMTTATTPPMTTETPTTKVTDVRLPKDLWPLEYHIELQPNMYDGDPDNFNFNGKVKIIMRCDIATDWVILHINLLTIDNSSLKLEDQTGASVPFKYWEEDKARQFFKLKVDGKLEKGKNYSIEMAYTGPLKPDLKGLYLSQYRSEERNKTIYIATTLMAPTDARKTLPCFDEPEFRAVFVVTLVRKSDMKSLSNMPIVDSNSSYIATTQMQPTDARKAFPCFDEPAIKSVFVVTLLRKNHMKSLSNMPIVRQENRPNNMVADVFQPTEKMSTYLLAFIICDFEYVERNTSRGTTVRIWARPEAMNQTAYADSIGADILEYFEDYYDVLFPLPKQDMIAIPDFAAGAMENWGLITYRETALLYDPKVSSASNKQRVAVVVAHELAHQWFGNLVTPKWWDDLWLNEGFASYVEYLGVNKVEPGMKMMEQFLVEDLQSVMKLDALGSSHPIYVPVGHPDEINEIFDRISYAKGASIIRMMNFFLGENTFKKGLTLYMNNKGYDAAFHDDLWEALTQQATADGKNIDVKAIMDTWTLQMGYPVVTVKKSGNDYKISQKHFLIDPTQVPDPKYPSPFGYKWSIPFTFTTDVKLNWNETNTEQMKWMMKTTEETIPASSVGSNPRWIIGNVQQFGYYRVNYEKENWEKILEQLESDHTMIHVKNRAQLIDDIFNIASSGSDPDVDTVLAMEATKYLAKEEEYLPWDAALTSVAYISGMLRRTEHYGNYKKYMLNQILPLYNKVGWEDTGSHLEQYNRINALSYACAYGHKPCRDKATQLYAEWMAKKDPDMDNPISPNLKSIVYCNAIQNGGIKEWDFAFERYQKANVASEKIKLLGAMACSGETWILSRYLTYAMDRSIIRRQDATSVINYISGSTLGKLLTWDFFRANWNKIKDEFASGIFAFSNLVKTVTSGFNTQFQLDQLEEFIKSAGDLGTGKRSFEQAVEATKANLKWMTANEGKLGNWLKNAASADKGRLTDVRLPLNLIPLHYKVELRPDLYSDDPTKFMFDGNVEIKMECKNATEWVIMHMNKLTIDEGTIELTNEAGVEVEHYGMEYDKDRQFLKIKAKTELQVGQKYIIKMKFVGPLKPDLAGLYLSQYTSQERNKTIYIATSQLQATDARKVFPCFDEPALKAKFEITLWRKEPMISLSNMPIIQKTTGADGWIADKYQETVEMSTYLLAFIVCDFENVTTTTSKGTTVRIWARPEAIDQTAYANSIGARILEHFESYYDVDYPLPKQDMIAIPDFAAGAMENWGLITYRETALLYDPKVSSASNKQRVAVVVAHELAHQWFGNLVTPQWWDDLWLNEGFASYVEYLGVDFVEPEMEMMQQFLVEDLQDVMKLDALSTSHPIYVPVANPVEIDEIFDRISYAKGASILRMINFFLGEQTFRKGLTRYLNDKKYKAAFHDDLWSALTQQSSDDGSNIDVKRVMDTWTLQMGYPVVKIEKSGNDYKASQKYFQIDPTVSVSTKYPSDFGYKWNIPLTFTTDKLLSWNGSDSLIWMNKDDAEVTIPSSKVGTNPTWIIGNVQQFGYYRVNYDKNNWEEILKQLSNGHTTINVKNRAQLLDDLFNIANSGADDDVDTVLAMRATEYLDKESDFLPWDAALINVAYIDTMLTKTGYYGYYQTYMLNKILPLYNSVGWEDKGTHLEQYNRINAISRACAYGHQHCLDKATELFKDWMDKADPDNENPISPNLKSPVYCNAIKNGGSEEWDFAFERYKKANVATEKSKLLYGMSCSQETWILSRYLDYSLQPEIIRRQDATAVMTYVSRNPIGGPLAWDYFRGQWDAIKERFGASTFSFGNLIKSITSGFNTQFQLQQVEEFVQSKGDLGTGQTAFEQSIETINANIKWMDKNEQKLGEWLKGKSSALPETGAKVKDVRLPLNLWPLHYKVELRPDMYGDDPKNFTFDGKVEIMMRCDNDTDWVIMHMNKLEIDESTIKLNRSDNGAEIACHPMVYDKDRQFLKIRTKSMLMVGNNYTIAMSFTGPLTNDLAGLYLSQYRSETRNKTIYIATTQMQPTDARKTFPCFDEPDIKAVFEVTLLRKAHMKSLSNMPITRNETRSNGWIADYFQPTVRMSTYLLAFIICDFKYVEATTKRNTTFRVWARPEAISQADYALGIGKDILTNFEDYYNIPYPLPKQDMIAIPDFAAGAMENWGLITYRETALLYDPKVSSASNKQRVAVVVAHELAHQWFGNLVSPEWWDDLWLNEGFASYVEYLGVDGVEPGMKMMEQFLVEDLQDVMKLDGLTTSHPVYVPVGHPDEINEIFDRISYAKGASIIRMMSFFLSEPTFKRGLTRYLNERAYKGAFHDDLWQALTVQASAEGKSINVKYVMDTWTLQMGYPLVTVKKGTGNQYNIKQKRFLIDPEAKPSTKYVSPFGYKWNIPFTYTTDTNLNWDVNDTDRIHWINRTEEDTITASGNWIMANIQQFGFYRVNYAKDNWMKILEQLSKNHNVINVKNRAQLIDDIFNIARSGSDPDVDITLAMESTKYLVNETEYIPWEAALVSVAYIDSMLSHTEHYGNYRKYMLSKILPLYDQVGWNDTGSHLEQYNRINAISRSCSYGYTPCRENATLLFADWMSKSNPDQDNPITPNLKTTVYCNAIRNGGIKEWDFAFERYQKANVATEKAKLLAAMSCTKETWILSRYLAYSLDENIIRRQDASSVISYIAGNTIGQPMAWDFLRARWSDILEAFGGSFYRLTNLIKRITSGFNTKFQLEQVTAFKNSRDDLGTSERALEQATESINANIKWMEKNAQKVGQWLENEVASIQS